MKHHALAISAAILLSACAGGSGAADSSTSQAEDPARAALPDNSGKVEPVQGEDPKRYYIANLRALNAVDKDKNGIWDDIEKALEERLKSDPNEHIRNIDRRPLLQVVRSFQADMQLTSKQEAQGREEVLNLEALDCLDAMIQAGALPREIMVAGVSRLTATYVVSIAEAAVMNSKERVLASAYADILASGGAYPIQSSPSLEACKK